MVALVKKLTDTVAHLQQEVLPIHEIRHQNDELRVRYTWLRLYHTLLVFWDIVFKSLFYEVKIFLQYFDCIS